MLQCHLCSYTGTTRANFNAHVNTHYTFQCVKCDFEDKVGKVGGWGELNFVLSQFTVSLAPVLSNYRCFAILYSNILKYTDRISGGDAVRCPAIFRSKPAHTK